MTDKNNNNEATVLYETEHYIVFLPVEPRIVDDVPLNYQMYNKTTGVTEGWAQIYPQAVGYVKQWDAMMRDITQEQEAKVFSLVKN